jgi:hypothetical protein
MVNLLFANEHPLAEDYLMSCQNLLPVSSADVLYTSADDTKRGHFRPSPKQGDDVKKLLLLADHNRLWSADGPIRWLRYSL